MILRTLFIPKGHKKEMKRIKTHQEREKREKVSNNSMKLFGVFLN